jgi:hypothetical protein
MNDFQKLGGVIAFLEAGIYILAFVFFGAFWDFPAVANNTQKLAFLANNYVMLSIVNLVMYILFGIFLAVLVLVIHQRLKLKALILSQLATVFGLIWVAFVIASGMIANIGLNTAIKLSVDDVEKAMTVWITLNTLVESLGGGNELVGGIWLTLLSFAAIKTNEFSKWTNYMGLVIGLIGIFTIYPDDILTEVFGLGQIIWFLGIGFTLLIKPKSAN